MFPLLTALAFAPLAPAAPPDFTPVDAAVEAAINRGDCPGAVVVVVHGDAVAFRKAYGLRAKVPADVPMTPDAVFDLASLTKPLATATAAWVLVERGTLKLSDPVAKHWPAFGANGKDAVTVEQCLLHTSGLTADNPEADYRDGRDKALERVAALKLEAPPGTRFKYSDVGFIALGVVVEKVAGKPLDEFAAETVFAPLKMADTTYKPGDALRTRAAPTGKREGAVIVGAVHDPRAFGMGGVAGHAGLFGTADDLARYARMMLRGGELDGVRVLSADAVKRFTEPVTLPPTPPAKAGGPPRANVRSRGWDIDTSYSGQRGEAFAKGTGFGHTGFTGTSLWLDPASGIAVVVLTSRLHPDDKGNVSALRREVATAAAKAVGAGGK